ncbi:MAG: hypothetical protein AAFP84_11150 [Actinomycetota bacterium]
MQITDTIKSVADSYTETSGKVIDTVVDVNKHVVEIVVSNVERFPETPLADRILAPAEAGKAYLDVVERAADFNRDLNRRVVEFLPVG